MKVSEKSLELNVGAELLGILRNQWGMPKAYLRGLTQSEEKQEGVDSFAQLTPTAWIFAFQFKAPKGRNDVAPYRYTLVSEQHALLFDLAQAWPGSVFYVFPFYVTPTKLQQDVPSLLQDTWLLEIACMPTDQVFGSQRTKVIRCRAGTAVINPEYRLHNLADAPDLKVAGIPAEYFASWYERHREVGRQPGRRKNPWLVRGLRVAIVQPTSGGA
jgi:hypothetical protein